MTTTEFAKALRDFAKELEVQLPNFMAQLALDAKDMIEQRVTQTGADANGNEFGQYVDGPYKQMREDRSLETAFVDFRNTGAMWKSINVVGSRISASLATVTLGSETQEEEDKLEWQHDRYGSEVLELSREEIEKLEVTYGVLVQNLLNQFIS